LEREDFTGNDPGNRSPGRGEEGDEEADEGNEDLLTGNVLGRDSGTNDSNDVLA